MPNTLDKILISEEAFNEKMDNIIIALHGISAGQGGHVGITTWKQVQAIVRAGLAPKMFSVGDKFIAPKESAVTATCSNSGVTVSVNEDTFIAKMGETGTLDYEATYDGIEWHDGESNIVLSEYGITISGTPASGDKIVVHETATNVEFVVLGFDQEAIVDSEREHSMTLQMLYTFKSLQFDAKEAFFANNTSNALPAGTYHFKVGAHSWVSGDVGKDIQFTLTQDLPVGGQLVFQQAYNATLVGGTIKAYASGATLDANHTEVATMSEGTDGTDLGTLLNSFPTSGTYASCWNSCQRALVGNNRWSQSALRQYLNSDALKGTYWAPKNIWDRQPSWFASEDGFMHNFDPELLAVIGEVKKMTDLNTVCDGGGEEETIDKLFLLSNYEIQSGTKTGRNPYPYWHNLRGDKTADWQTDPVFIKYNKKGGTAQYWWLRSPGTSDAGCVRVVDTSGYVSNGHAHNGFGVALALSII